MRLSDILSKDISSEYEQVEGFLGNRRLKSGKSKKLEVGKVALNFHCVECSGQRTFYSNDELFCIGIDDNKISIDCVLTCPRCGASTQVWFLLESKLDDLIHGLYPYIKIIKKSEKLHDNVKLNHELYGDFTEALEKSKRAARDGLGAGSLIYLRKIYESVTTQLAISENIPLTFIDRNGTTRNKSFRNLLQQVDEQCQVIPREFSENGYQLFGDLSNIVHGEYDEEEALQKHSAFYRLVVGVLDNIKNNREIMEAIGTLGWTDGGETSE